MYIYIVFRVNPICVLLGLHVSSVKLTLNPITDLTIYTLAPQVQVPDPPAALLGLVEHMIGYYGESMG